MEDTSSSEDDFDDEAVGGGGIVIDDDAVPSMERPVRRIKNARFKDYYDLSGKVRVQGTMCAMCIPVIVVSMLLFYSVLSARRRSVV